MKPTQFSAIVVQYLSPDRWIVRVNTKNPYANDRNPKFKQNVLNKVVSRGVNIVAPIRKNFWWRPTSLAKVLRGFFSHSKQNTIP
jgi:hypothetical protein